MEIWISLAVAAVYVGVVVYVLVLLTGMAKNISRQCDSIQRIADIMDRERTS